MILGQIETTEEKKQQSLLTTPSIILNSSSAQKILKIIKEVNGILMKFWKILHRTVSRNC